MTAKASQITSLTVVYSTVYSGADQRKHQSSASLAFVRGIHRWPVNSPHKRPVTRKMFSFNDVIMHYQHVWPRGIQSPGDQSVTSFRPALQQTSQTATLKIHDDVIKWKHFPRNWPFVRGIQLSRWILHTKASDAELWCFLWSASE